jgi:hypothetical protein
MKRLILVAALALLAAPAAHAATWRQVTASGGDSIDQVGLVRTSDGVLHVAWHKDGDLQHTAIARNGRIGATSPIQSGWTGHMDAALTAVPGGIRVVWGAIRSTDTNDPNQDLNTALSTDGGTSWQLTPGSIIPRGAQAYGSDAAATTLPDGTVLEAWAGTLGTWVHSGLDAATPNVDYQAPLGPYGYGPGLASDAAGRAMMAWFSSSAARRGVIAQGVNADGSPAGAALTMPGSQVMEGGGTVSRTPIVARAGGGFYVAYALGYPTANQVRVWRVGAGSARRLARTDANSQVTLAADPRGRIWVVWSDGTFGETHVLAARSNPEATTFGAAVDAGAVRDAHSTYSVDASATGSALDILALFGTGTSSGGATYATRIEPGLTLKARKRGGRVTFTVTDAGDPVRGATVRLAGRSARTNRKGRATLALARGRATASAPGYTPARLRVTSRRAT